MNVKTWLGAGLVVLGLFVFTNQGAVFTVGDIFATFWPSIFILPLGIFFHWLYFGFHERSHAGVLVPGGLLITLAAVFQISALYDLWHITWPGFILAPAVGLFELYWFGGKEKGLLIPIAILTAISMLFFAVFTFESIFNYLSDKPIVAIAIIAFGALLMIGQKREA
jgi:hypothetical protein